MFEALLHFQMIGCAVFGVFCISRLGPIGILTGLVFLARSITTVKYLVLFESGGQALSAPLIAIDVFLTVMACPVLLTIYGLRKHPEDWEMKAFLLKLVPVSAVALLVGLLVSWVITRTGVGATPTNLAYLLPAVIGLAYFAIWVWRYSDSIKSVHDSWMNFLNIFYGLLAGALFLGSVVVVISCFAWGEMFWVSVRVWILVNVGLTVFALFLISFAPELLGGGRGTIRKNPYARTTLNGVDTKKVRGSLQRLEQEKFFCDEDITLPRLAAETELSLHQLSEFLNVEMEMTFKTYVNRLRIQEACRMLREDNARTILSIAMAVGFNSISAFNRAFRRELGMTALTYRGATRTESEVPKKERDSAVRWLAAGQVLREA